MYSVKTFSGTTHNYVERIRVWGIDKNFFILERKHKDDYTIIPKTDLKHMTKT